MKFVHSLIFTLLLMALTCQTAAQAGQAQGVDELLRSADQGHPPAMLDLGRAYYHGNGVLKDPFKAKCWVEKAREAGLDTGDDQTVRRAEALWEKLELWQYSGECALERPLASGPAVGDRFVEPVTGIAFVWIPGKCFSTGAGRDKKGAKKGRACPEGFWMGQYEVTQAQWRRIMSSNPSRFKGDDLPVEQVTYEAVQDFIRRLNQTTGREFFLPTEVQWEFACTDRGRRQSFPWGRDERRPRANCGGCDTGGIRGKTSPVGSFPPNALGLYDMGGNVREWCEDSRRGRYHDKGRDRPFRGGSFVDSVKKSGCRSGDRMITGLKAYYLGFRLVAEDLD